MLTVTGLWREPLKVLVVAQSNQEVRLRVVFPRRGYQTRDDNDLPRLRPARPEVLCSKCCAVSRIHAKLKLSSAGLVTGLPVDARTVGERPRADCGCDVLPERPSGSEHRASCAPIFTQ